MKLGVVAGIALTVGPASDARAQAEESGRLRFEDDRVLTIPWDDTSAGSTVDVEICNIDAAAEATVDARLTGFQFTSGGEPLDGAPFTVELTGGQPLAAGACGTIAITASPNADQPLDPGAYEGVLVASTPGGLVRRGVAIVGPTTTGGGLLWQPAESTDGETAPTGEPVEGIDAEPVELSWPDLAAGHELVLCNNGAALDAPSASISGFRFRKLDGTVAGASSILSATIDGHGPFATGSCRTLTIYSADGLGDDNPLLPNTSPYYGTISVTSGKTTIEQDLTVEGAASVPYTGVLGNADITGSLGWPTWLAWKEGHLGGWCFS